MTGSKSTWWPAEDADGLYEVHCSCERWTFTGTAVAIAAAGRNHDDSPRRNHIVGISNGGRRVDEEG